MSRRSLYFVNHMDREAKEGKDPHAWLTAQLLRLKYQPGCTFEQVVRFDYAQRLLNRAKRETNEKTREHCQICSRNIQANTGVIAHHGYTRPGYGWQTASCFGARYRSYELACDALPPYIEMVTGWRERQAALVTSLTKSPPDVLTRFVKHPQTRLMIEEKFDRPVDFDAKNKPATWIGRDWTYTREFFAKIGAAEIQIDNATNALRAARKRLADWRKP